MQCPYYSSWLLIAQPACQLSAEVDRDRKFPIWHTDAQTWLIHHFKSVEKGLLWN